MATSSDNIRIELEKLVGLPVWSARFGADMLILHFGQRHEAWTRRRQRVEVGDFALHVQCAWRFVLQDEIAVGSRDHFCNSKSGNTANILWRIDSLIADEPHVDRVTHVSAGAFGLEMQGGLILETFAAMGDQRDREFWRMFQPCGDTPHFVVGAFGIR